mmetsp:Transcript_32372/g.52339  ORF Transcript_32372/g.52339 Transcript_32372/m.52339 type:complete len:201 (+) Transcript_32372:1416-2018(+)
MPPWEPTLDRSLADASERLAELWAAPSPSPAPAVATLPTTTSVMQHQVDGKDFTHLTAKQRKLFLTVLMEKEHIAIERLAELDKLYHLSKTNNVEVGFSWFLLCLRNRYTEPIPDLITYLSHHGHVILLRPLYQEFAKVNFDLAKQTYVQNRQRYAFDVTSALDPTFDKEKHHLTMKELAHITLTLAKWRSGIAGGHHIH